MHSLLWIFVGLVAGWLAGKSLEGEGYGPSVDIAMGIAGALIGGVMMRSLGFSGYAGTAFATLVAIICAVLLTTLTALSNGRRIHTRELWDSQRERVSKRFTLKTYGGYSGRAFSDQASKPAGPHAQPR